MSFTQKNMLVIMFQSVIADSCSPPESGYPDNKNNSVALNRPPAEQQQIRIGILLLCPTLALALAATTNVVAAGKKRLAPCCRRT